MKASYFYLYIAAGFLLLGIGIYRVIRDYPAMHASSFYVFVPAAMVFYIAVKAYLEKKDSDLM